MEERRPEGYGWSLLVAAASILVAFSSVAPQVPATGLILIAMLLAGAAVTFPQLVQRMPVMQPALVRLLALGLATQAILLVIVVPVRAAALTAILLLTAGAAVHAILGGGRWRREEMAVVILVHAAVGAWLIASLGPPAIDVYLFQQEGSRALASGMNPYELRYENIYGAGTPYYAEEIQVGERLTIGFIYPPLALFGVVPGYLLFGDYRYTLLVATTVAALLLLGMRRTDGAVGAAALLVFSPLNFYLYGWNEPLVGLLLIILAFAALRRWPLVPLFLALLINMKQYVVLVLPLAVVLLRGARQRHGWSMLVAVPALFGAATVLPFLALEPMSFVFSVVVFQILQPLRVDSVSIPGVVALLGGPELPAWVAFVAAAIALVVCLRRAPRTPAGLCIAVAVVFLAFFVTSKQGFENYYFFATVALLGALAAAGPSGDDPLVGDA